MDEFLKALGKISKLNEVLIIYPWILFGRSIWGTKLSTKTDRLLKSKEFLETRGKKDDFESLAGEDG